MNVCGQQERNRMQIKGYEIKGELKTNNSGFSKWGFATKNGRDYFIKEFIDIPDQ